MEQGKGQERKIYMEGCEMQVRFTQQIVSGARGVKKKGRGEKSCRESESVDGERSKCVPCAAAA